MRNKLIILFFIIGVFQACETDKETLEATSINEEKEVQAAMFFGFNFNNYNVVFDTVQRGNTLGGIFDRHGVLPQTTHTVATVFKDSFDARRIRVGRPYVVLKAKDSADQTQVLIYEKNRAEYTVFDLRDTINVYNASKPITVKERVAAGVINSSLSETLEANNLSPVLTEKLADIYAWTVNFFHLQKGDNFKIVYTQNYIYDSIPSGIRDIKAAYFEHRGKAIYAFPFVPADSSLTKDFYDTEANNLRRAFLRSPIKFNYRISSRYNLKRRIAYYGNRVRPHKGTDFAAPVGTPILATADGVVTQSARRGGNGNFVKIRHNGRYETQYLHMKKRKVKKGDYVRQGDVIGWVGMTGNTSGPHVCYRFWKNGKQVDPFKQDLPKSEPLPKQHHKAFYQSIEPLKYALDCIAVEEFK